MKSQKALAKIEIVKREIDEAETDLEKVMRDVTIAPRAEKTAITDVVRAALARLNVARKNLHELEELVTTDDP